MNKIIKTVYPVGQAKFLQEKDNSFFKASRLSKDLQFGKRSKPKHYYTRENVDSEENLKSRRILRGRGNKISQGAINFIHFVSKKCEYFDATPKYQSEEYEIFIIDGEHYLEIHVDDAAESFNVSKSTIGRWTAEGRKNGVLKAVRKYTGHGKQTLMYRVEGLEEWRYARKRKEQEKYEIEREKHNKRMEKQRQRRAAAKAKPKTTRDETAFVGTVIKNINIFSCSTINKTTEEQEIQKVPWNITKDNKLTLSSKAIDFFRRLGEPQKRQLYIQQLLDEGKIPTEYTKKGTKWLFQCSFWYLPFTVKLMVWSKAFGRNLEGYFWAQTTRKATIKNLTDRLLKAVLNGLKNVILYCHSTIAEWLNDGDCPFSSDITTEQLLNCQDISEFPEHIASFIFEKFLDMLTLSRVHKSSLIAAFNKQYGSRILY